LADVGRTLRLGRKNIPLASQTNNTEITECVAAHSEGVVGFSCRNKEDCVSYIQVP
jgi:hypothetical protein